MTTNTYGGYTIDQLREFIRHHYDAEHGGDNIDELTNDSSASVKIVRDLLDAIEPQQDGDLLRPIARWVYNAVRVNLDLLHGICSEFGCPQGEDVATWLRDRLSNEKSPAPEQASEAAQQRSGMDRPFTEVVPAAEVIVDARAGDGNETSSKVSENVASIKVEIDYAADDSCQLQCWARGHHDRAAFLKACEAALSDWDGRVVCLDGKPVKRLHWRTVRPDAETAAFGVVDCLHVESKPGRGAYAVTVLDEWLPLFTPMSATA
ncbi:hypothetical protein SB394_02600 [Burkholderia sp. BCCIQ04A]|uniref:Uncharacterized protein n=1 Tax=Burkholderia anthinoferrum TaxID=3090833 RepID=A0ABU5WTQ1_9BURK|nr:hypothetical protein [Burkholderia anthinoferrum]MEB2535855.1 hypothetical protein [Burkholderia anthinoferrum]MEB2561983.1 hypothetical protein [Burkholderia anthinoferrum]MEB2582284.1 hypothetical protein [Burkholderia anthinoferrum]MEB2632609.1 hypothetical protein [Burkholderia anthinoferrum]